MSTTDPAKETRTDEIDLRDLFNRMGRTLSKWFRAIGRGFLVSTVFLIKNFLPLFLSVIIGAGFSYALKWSIKPVYVSEMTLRSNTVTNAEMIANINQLDLLLKEKNYGGISTALSIDPAEASKIKHINAFWVIDKNYDSIPDYVDYRNSHNVYDSVNVRMNDRFVIKVQLKDPAGIPKMKDRIFSYVNNNPVLIQQNDLRLRLIDELLARLNHDIEQLDSLQKVKYFEETRNMKPEKGGQMIFIQEHATQLIYNDIYALYDRKHYLDQQKNLHNEILTVISDFLQPLKRHNGGWYYGKFVIPVCFALTIILLIIIRNREKLKEVFRKY
ncbi:MAG TPA: hypothetical protein DDW27_19315 [Bacteroidales bacterium]|nr:hypothetical protein [Bacteroidales bacterium]